VLCLGRCLRSKSECSGEQTACPRCLWSTTDYVGFNATMPSLFIPNDCSISNDYNFNQYSRNFIQTTKYFRHPQASPNSSAFAIASSQPESTRKSQSERQIAQFAPGGGSAKIKARHRSYPSPGIHFPNQSDDSCANPGDSKRNC